MATQTAQYDHIGSKYDAYAHTATGKRAERHTLFRMVGALAGKRVLDLACGFGFYTRLPKQWALQEAGFRDCTWYPAEVAPADMTRYGDAYWRGFYDNCPIIGLICQK